jgi:acyl-CoA synthetase (AMP-forming)/AMP-acid ligase II
VLGPYGLRADALTPAYGLAEATLAVTIEDVGAMPAVIEVDAEALAAGSVLEAHDSSRVARLVSVGRPLADVDVEVKGEPDLAEIVVRSPSLAAGYVRDPAASAETFRNGSLFTGDLGFLADGKLYVAGREDDRLVVAGRNVDARPVESALAEHAEVRNGSATLVAHHDDGRPKLVAYVEPQSEDVDADRLTRELAKVARAIVPLPIDEWVLVARGRMPRTPSGKVQRFRLRMDPPGADNVVGRVGGG